MTSRWAGLAIGLLLVVAGLSLGTAGCDPCPSCSSHSQPTPPASSATGQGLVAIDTVNNVGYVPIYTLTSGGGGPISPDASPAPATSVPGSSQLAVVDLTIGASSPIIKLIELSSVVEPTGGAFNEKNGRVYAEGVFADGSVSIFEIDTTTQAVINTIPCPGITQDGTWGGIVVDPVRNLLVVAGTSTIGLMDTSVEPPVFNAASVVSVAGTDSLSLDTTTGILFVSTDGTNQIINIANLPLVVLAFEGTDATTDGVGFDPATNILLQTDEVGADHGTAFNFATLDTSVTPATALHIGFDGLGVLPPLGEGPGGQAVVNGVTHQGVISDEFGQNLKMIHLPVAKVAGALDNNGQPGSSTNPDAASVFTICATIIPKGDVDGTPTQLGIVGDPNSLSIDVKNNLAYMLADTLPAYHSWANDHDPTPALFLVRVDLSAPVLGGSPTGSTQWNPTSVAIPMP
ncbi:MAG: hypothetical protein WCE23_11065 [Candidatus Binatus sp.]|uniref:hypothetical protein n=1 Tax=Candidatus Binatus sp. TaxID=2811406 RepID=UPI003C7516C1